MARARRTHRMISPTEDELPPARKKGIPVGAELVIPQVEAEEEEGTTGAASEGAPALALGEGGTMRDIPAAMATTREDLPMTENAW